MEKLLFIDVETSGVDRKRCSIWSISGFIEIDGVIQEDFDFKIKPHKDTHWDQWVFDNTEVTSLSVLESFTDQKIVFEFFIGMLQKYVDPYDSGDKFHLVAYNAVFDDDFLREWFNFNNHKYYGSFIWGDKIDIMAICSYTFRSVRHQLPNFKLETLCKLLGIELDAHNSYSDISATREIYKQLNNEFLIIKPFNYAT